MTNTLVFSETYTFTSKAGSRPIVVAFLPKQQTASANKSIQMP